MLRVSDLHAFYGKSHVLQGVALEVRAGELVGLLGRNGVGKTTTLRAILGTVLRSGQVVFAGEDLSCQRTHTIARRGLALVPEHRGIFRQLTVEENLRIAERRGSRWRLADAYAFFPRLHERRRNAGGNLSGGEQQMLAIARALLNAPRLLLLDEPTEGLAPVVVEEIVERLRAIKDSGVPMLLVEQNIDVCLELADRVYILDQGRSVYTASKDAFAQDERIRARHLAV